MKDKVFGVLQRLGQSFMLPIAILPVAGFLVALSSALTNETMIAAMGLERLLGEETVFYTIFALMNRAGKSIFDNLPLLFAVGVAIGMAKRAKEVAAVSASVAYLVMHATINTLLVLSGQVLDNGELAADVMEGTLTCSFGMWTLQMGVFGGMIVGLGVAYLHNRFNKIVLPDAISFFGGTRFVPIISTITYILVGILMYFIWVPIQQGIYMLGDLMAASAYVGTFAFGVIKRLLLPFGLHHVFYVPFWQTAIGGSMEIAGEVVEGGQNIFFAQLANSSDVLHFSAEATRFFSGEFIFMMFGLPGAALAMYHCAKPERKKAVGKLLLSASLGSFLMGITEPLEFSFLFVAPELFAAQVILAGSAYMVAHMLNIAVGVTFSGGFFDLFLYGILQGNGKTSWLLILPAGIVYFLLYYVIFRLLIVKFNFKTPGREEENEETKLYTQLDVEEKKQNKQEKEIFSVNTVSEAITKGLGGKKNIRELDCCATRLRCSVHKAELVNQDLLKSSGATGVLQSGNAVQVIFGPRVTIIKSNLEDYLDHAPNVEYLQEKPIMQESRIQEENGKEIMDKQETKHTQEKVISSIIISSPITGIAADLSTTPDKTFAERMVGDGAVLTPEENLVRAPEDGKIGFLFETKHAFLFTTDSGVNLMIHVGIDTVELNGQGFESFVEVGQHVRKGEALLKVDLDYVKSHAPSLATPMICPDLGDNQKIRLLKEGEIKAGEALFAIDTVEE